MAYRWHGLTSMVLFTIAVLLAMVVIARTSWWGVAGFVVVNILSSLGIAYSYCAKCTCRAHRCSHMVIGKIADFLPQRPQRPYTLGDYAGMFLSGGIVFVYPLYWLWQDKAMLVAFFAVGMLAVMEIMLAVCPHCSNTHCPAHGWTHNGPRTTKPSPEGRTRDETTP